MKKIICALALGLLATSFSAIQAKNKGLTSGERALEAAKGTGLAVVTASNAFGLYVAATVLSESIPETFRDPDADYMAYAMIGVAAIAYATVVYATIKGAQFSYQAFKKAIMNPKTEKVKVVETDDEDEVVLSRKK